jgi:hypothetical protein
MEIPKIGKIAKTALVTIALGYLTSACAYNQKSEIKGGHAIQAPSSSLIASLAERGEEQKSPSLDDIVINKGVVDLGNFSSKIPSGDLELRKKLQEASFTEPVTYKIGNQTFFINPEHNLTEGLKKKEMAYDAFPNKFAGKGTFVNIPAVDTRMLNVEGQNYESTTFIKISPTGNMSSTTTLTPADEASFKLYLKDDNKKAEDVLGAIGIYGGVTLANPALSGYAAGGSVIYLGYKAFKGGNGDADAKMQGAYQATIDATMDDALKPRDVESRLTDTLLAEYDRVISMGGNNILSLHNDKGTNSSYDLETGVMTITQDKIDPEGVKKLFATAFYRAGVPIFIGALAGNSTKFTEYETITNTEYVPVQPTGTFTGTPTPGSR